MKTLIQAYLATLFSFLAIDAVWLTLATKPMYTDTLGSLMRDPPGLIAAAAFYTVYCAGIVYFAVLPGANAESLRLTAVNGALIGLLSYGTFAATNLSVLKPWTPSLAAVDTVWGVIVTAAAASCGYLASAR